MGTSAGLRRGKEDVTTNPTSRAASLAGLVGGAALVHVLYLWFLCDDAFIAFRYARNLAEGHGVVFNPGERVEGYTSLLWVLVNGAVHAAGARADLWAPRLSAAAAIASLLLVVHARLRGGRDGLVFGVLTAGSAGWAAWATGGLETGLFTALVTLSFLQTHAGRLGAAGALLGVACLTRPEGVLLGGLFGLFLGVSVLRGQDTLPRVATWAALWLVPVAAHLVGRLAYYGDPLPNTFHVKAQGVSMLAPGLEYLAYAFTRLHLYLLLVPFGLLALRRIPRGPVDARLLALAAAVVPAFLGYVVSVGGDFMDLFRFLVPVLPIAFLATGEVASAYARGPIGRATVVAGLAGWVILNGATSKDARGIHYRHQLDSIGQLAAYVDDWSNVGRFLARATAPSDTIATSAAGCIPYYSRRHTIDQLGLVDPDPDRFYVRDVARSGHGRQMKGEALLELHPQFLLGSAVVTPAAEMQLSLYIEPGWEERFEAAYRTVSVTPPELGGRRVSFAVRNDVVSRGDPAPAPRAPGD